MLTIRLALYLSYNTVQSKLGSSHAACGRCLDRVASNVHLTKMRSVPLIRCLPKMTPSSSTSTGSQIATWRRSLTWTRREFSYYLQSPSTGKMFVWSPAFLTEPGSTRYSSAPPITTVWSNYQTSYNDFFEVCISNTVTLSPQCSKWYLHQFNFFNVNHVTKHFSSSLVNSLVADLYRYDRL